LLAARCTVPTEHPAAAITSAFASIDNFGPFCSTSQMASSASSTFDGSLLPSGAISSSALSSDSPSATSLVVVIRSPSSTHDTTSRR
jgi:hypothetical protein